MCSMGKSRTDHLAHCHKLRLGQDGVVQHLFPHIVPVLLNIMLDSSSIVPASPPHCSSIPLHCSSIPLHCSSISPHCSSISPHCSGLQVTLLPSGPIEGPAACPGCWGTELWGSSPARKKDLMCQHSALHVVSVRQKELVSITTVRHS